MINLSISFHCDQGPRDSLEDSARTLFISVGEPMKPDLGLLSVFDGVGGQAAGEVASNEAGLLVAGSAAMFAADHAGKGLANEQVAAALKRFLHTANEEILRLQEERPDRRGMATTAVCAAIHEASLVVAWCGDSRCYHERRGEIQRLTRDHTVAEELVMLGLISRREIYGHPRRHEITQHLGKRDGVRSSTVQVDLDTGDVVVLCSDGLTDVIGDLEIGQIIDDRRRRGDPFEGLARELVETALDYGTTDNVTVLCARCDATGGPYTVQTSTLGYPTEAARAAALLLNQQHGVTP